MTGLFIFLGILILLLAILFIRVGIIIDYHGENLILKLKILGIPIPLMPQEEKKRKIRLKDFSHKAMVKKQRAAAKAKEKKSEKKSKDKVQQKEKAPLTEVIPEISRLVKHLLEKFLGHLRIDITKIYISVGSDNAATTAIMFGIINQAAAALLDILSAITNVKKNRKSEISVVADFTSDKIKADINIGFSLLMWQLLSIAFGTLFRYVGNMIKKQTKR